MKLKRLLKFIFAGMLVLGVILSFSACSEKDKNKKEDAEASQTEGKGGKFIIELYPEHAPLTVENFMSLVNDGFYDGLTFHRIVDGFMAQGGGYDPNGDKKNADTIFGEFSGNGFEQNTLSHTGGVISMARVGGANDSASSEFFICFDDIRPMQTASLDGEYASFGKVIEGMEIIEALKEVERTMLRGELASPIEPVIIKKMVILENDSENPRVEVEIEYK